LADPVVALALDLAASAWINEREKNARAKSDGEIDDGLGFDGRITL
jgi:hypothetical protein